MPVTIDGTTGVTTPGATVGAITGILKATSGVVSQAVAGTDYLTSTSGGAITLGTAQTPSGVSAVDFTGIPSWVKRITVMFQGVSTNGGSQMQIQLGAGSVVISNYKGSVWEANTTNSLNSTGFRITGNMSAADIWNGSAIISNMGSNVWTIQSIFGRQDVATSAISGGSISVGGTLDRLRITTLGGTDTFDAGTINISYE